MSRELRGILEEKELEWRIRVKMMSDFHLIAIRRFPLDGKNKYGKAFAKMTTAVMDEEMAKRGLTLDAVLDEKEFSEAYNYYAQTGRARAKE